MSNTQAHSVRQPFWPRALRWNLTVAAFIAAIIVCWTFVDLPFQLWIREYYWTLYRYADLYTKLGSSAWILIGSATIIAVSFLWPKLSAGAPSAWLTSARDGAAYIFVAVAVSGTAISLIKNTIGRARPKHLDTLGPFHFEFAAFESSFAAFPSGHSTTFGAAAAALGLLFPRAALVLLPLGLLGGLSRVALGAHWLSDVLAGLACGAVFALLLARSCANREILFTLAEGDVWPRRR